MADAPLSPADVTIRSLAGARELEQCLDLQRATWGDDFRELVPPTILMISQKVGGSLLGAFAPDGDLLGFVFGITGIRYGRIAHWSHMLAVQNRARGLGLGKLLKLRQRDDLLRLGCEVMYWTFDPLVARNASLNLRRLGALPVEYVRDMYGDNSGSVMHSGLGTDRFVAGWELGSARVVAAIDRGVRHETAPPGPEALVANPRGADGLPGDQPPGAGEIERAGELFVEIPADIDSVRDDSLEVGRAWRRSTRAGIEAGLGAGLVVTGLAVAAAVPPGGQRRYYYRLSRA